MKVALLHALPLNREMWVEQEAALAGHELFAPSLYCLGDGIDDWARTILDLLPGELVAVGASMGGYTAAALARLAPERLRGIVLAGSRADADPPDRRPARDAWARVAREEGPEGLWREMAPRLFTPHSDPEVVERARAIALEQRAEWLGNAVEAIRDRSDSTAAVTCGIPLLVVAGDLDPLVPREVAEALAAASPAGRAVVLEGCGHLPSLERPAEFNRVLTAFLEDL